MTKVRDFVAGLARAGKPFGEIKNTTVCGVSARDAPDVSGALVNTAFLYNGPLRN